MSKKIIEYIILYSLFISDLEERVEDFIEDGFQPLGAPFFTSHQLVEHDGHKTFQTARYNQAMVKYEE